MHTSRDDLDAMVMGDYEGRHIDAGAMRIAFESMPAHFPPDESIFKGLPDDRCQCEHWGYVIKGKVSFKTGDGEETFETGDAYYVGPGHTPVLYAGTEIVEFSPTKELQQTMEVIEKNMESAAV
jgi:hypothetical protein